METSSAHIFPLPIVCDERGSLGFIDAVQHLPFEIRRIFYIYHTHHTAHRGGHAHKTLHECIISLGSPITLRVHDGKKESTFVLQPHTQGFYLPPRHWLNIDNLNPSTILLGLCSAPYDEADYLRDFAGFLEHCRSSSST